MFDLRLIPAAQVPALPVPGAGRVLLFVDEQRRLAFKTETGAPAAAAGVRPVFVDVAIAAKGNTSAAHGVDTAASVVADWGASCQLSSGAIVRMGDATAAQQFTVTVNATQVTVTAAATATAIIGRTVRVVLWVKG